MMMAFAALADDFMNFTSKQNAQRIIRTEEVALAMTTINTARYFARKNAKNLIYYLLEGIILQLSILCNFPEHISPALFSAM